MNNEVLNILSEQLQGFESDLMKVVEEQKNYIEQLEKRICTLEDSSLPNFEDIGMTEEENNNDPESWIQIGNIYYQVGLFDTVSVEPSKIVLSGENTDKILWLDLNEVEIKKLLRAIGGNNKTIKSKRLNEYQLKGKNAGSLWVANVYGQRSSKKFEDFPKDFQRKFLSNLKGDTLAEWESCASKEVRGELIKKEI